MPLPRVFTPRTFTMRLATVQRVHSSPYGGSEQAVDMLNDRWMASLELSARTQDEAANIEAFLAAMPAFELFPHFFVVGHDGGVLASVDADVLIADARYDNALIAEFVRRWTPPAR